MTLHMLSAGSGYEYLTRQVAALDSTEKGTTPLSDYYSAKGESPGCWVGSGLIGIDGLDAGDVVTAEQMKYLFGTGGHPLPPGFRFPFTVPDRLWRLEAPACFRTIKFFDLTDEDNDKFWWNLSLRADRKLVYERLLTFGSEPYLVLYLDAALLIDLWPEMEVPEPMRTHWATVIEATMQTPIPPEHELSSRDQDTRRTARDVVKHASSCTLGATREDVSEPSTNVDP